MKLDDGFDAVSIAGKNIAYEETIELMKKLPCQPWVGSLEKKEKNWR